MSKAETSQDQDRLVCMAEIVGVHGVRGVVKIKFFGDDPEILVGDVPLCDAAGKKQFVIEELQDHSNILLATIEGIADRTAAEKLRGTKLYLPRSCLPQIDKKDTYYHTDLIGLAASWPDGKPMGKIIAVTNFGAGDLLEVKPPQGNSFYIPFTQQTAPHVDIAAGTITLDPPPGLLD